MGLEAGALLFVSMVDARTIQAAGSSNDPQLIRRFFPIWWPFGAQLMAPLGLMVIGSNAAAFYRTRRAPYAIAAGTGAFILFWTTVVMGKSIADLRSENTALSSIIATALQFVSLHHVRTIAALSAFATLLFGL